MTEREKLARALCEHHGLDPDKEAAGLGKSMEKGRKYKLWEYQAEHYVDVLQGLTHD